MTNPVSLPSFYCLLNIPLLFDSSWHLFISHMIGPPDHLHPPWFQTFSVLWMLFSLFWVILRLLNFIFWRFGTHCSIFIGGVTRQNLPIFITYTAYEDGTECSETSACKTLTPGNHPKERIQHIHPSPAPDSRTSKVLIPDVLSEIPTFWHHTRLCSNCNTFGIMAVFLLHTSGTVQSAVKVPSMGRLPPVEKR